MTLTAPATDTSVWLAPVGTDPADAGAWTHIGYVSDMTFETDDDSGHYLPDDWPARATTTITVPLRVIRHLLRPTHLVCEWTLRGIEEHAQRSRITAALAEALASPRLPCPLPFPARRAAGRCYQP
ncbi:hypothetical protein [Streptomyces coeruleorubidus]|uniref:hypothetical protein n=1 Tax=Streptomyces coeruleorubidus TaxID=116188 RepID=UPI0033BC518B